MANFVRANPSGWAPNAQLTSAQANALDIDHTKAPNFDDGSTHTAAAVVTIGGAGMHLADRLSVEAVVVTMADANTTIRDIGGGGAIGTIYEINSTAITASRNITLDKTSVRDGELALVCFKDAHGTHTTPLFSEGGGSPIYTNAVTPTLSPDWVLCRFKSSADAWITIAHGRV